MEERTREMIARNVFGKTFEECSECEKEAIHNLIIELRKKLLLKRSI